MNDPVNKTVLEQEFTGLKTFWQFQTDGIPNRAFARKANQSARFSQSAVALKRKNGSNATHCWVGEHRDVEPSSLTKAPQGC